MARPGRARSYSGLVDALALAAFADRAAARCEEIDEAVRRSGEGADPVCVDRIAASDITPDITRNHRHTERRARDGAKSLARIEHRMAKRADRTALRDALDLIRQQELRDNMAHREARTRQRRWFVLGRAVEEAMRRDTGLHATISAVLDSVLQRPDERQLLGLAPNVAPAE